jgi:thiamine-phosphate pyrophosphorylase
MDHAAYRRSLADRPPPAGPDELPLPLHPLTYSSLRQARAVARDIYGEATVASESILLTLLRADPSLGTYLEPFGLCLVKLEAEVEAMRPAPLQMEEPLLLEEAATDEVDTHRILDAAGNRAREGLRVVEDYCRFVLDDVVLSGELKRLRHDLAEALAELPAEDLLQARETRRDVGTELSTESEQQRYSLAEVLCANLKRLQEALRSLEEYAKVHSPPLGQKVEQLRYRSYTLERALVLGTAARQRLAEAHLYVLLSAEQCEGSLRWTIEEAAAGGAHLIQLREKGLPDRELLERARRVREWTRKAGLLFILNDRADVARLVEADGVHLGQDDLPVKEARRVLGPGGLVGVSTHTIEQVRQAVLDGASYIGVGPTFPSGTKEFGELAGLDFVRQATAQTSLPAFVIGGVNLNTIAQAVAAGARRVAVSQAIGKSSDPRSVAMQLLYALPRK